MIKSAYLGNELVKKIYWGVDLVYEQSVIPEQTSGISLCDVAYWDGSSVKTVAKDEYTTDLGTAIGVVVIPSGMLPDGRARMVGLKPVDENGNASDSHVGMSWCNKNSDTSLTNYTVVPTTDNAGSTSTGSYYYGYLPSDKFTGATSYVDSGAKYNKTSYLVPSPYLYNGGELTFNPEYSKAIEGNNALSDFNGLSNTETLIGLEDIYKAAKAAWNYSDGVSNTQWYLPAAGELGFLMPRFNEINSALTSVGGVSVNTDGTFWSSTEYNSDLACCLTTNNGYSVYGSKNNNYSRYYVRVFGVI